MALKTPIIAIVGRPNVGKSTLFNRVLGKKLAVVEDYEGVTRDRNYALVSRFSIPFYIVDTGGFETGYQEASLESLVVEQTKVAAEEADIVFAIFDAKSGMHPGDEEVVKYLRRFSKPIYYIANKVDGNEQSQSKFDFYGLGISEIFDVSALHGRNVNDLIEQALHCLDNYGSLLSSYNSKRENERRLEIEAASELENHLEKNSEKYEREEQYDFDEDFEDEDYEYEEEDENKEIVFAPVFLPENEDFSEKEYLKEYSLVDKLSAKKSIKPEEVEVDSASEADQIPDIACINFALIGRPNVGKSTLLNTLTGEQRSIASPMAGTTRDIVDAELLRDGQHYRIIDTAGLRKKARVTDKIEKYSTMRALNAISESDVIVLVIDASLGPSEQDTKILGLAHDQGAGIVIAINKWDLVDKDHKTVKEYTRKVRETFKFAPYAPIIFITATTGKRCPRIIEEVNRVAKERLKRVSTNKLNRIIENAIKRRPLPIYRGKRVKMYFAAQVAVAPPRFALFFNFPKAVHFSNMRFIKNSIREAFSFDGTDIKIMCRKR